MVTVAQLAERWIVVPNVVGSSPISHPKTSETSEVFFCLPLTGVGSVISAEPSKNRRGAPLLVRPVTFNFKKIYLK